MFTREQLDDQGRFYSQLTTAGFRALLTHRENLEYEYLGEVMAELVQRRTMIQERIQQMRDAAEKKRIREMKVQHMEKKIEEEMGLVWQAGASEAEASKPPVPGRLRQVSPLRTTVKSGGNVLGYGRVGLGYGSGAPIPGQQGAKSYSQPSARDGRVDTTEIRKPGGRENSRAPPGEVKQARNDVSGASSKTETGAPVPKVGGDEIVESSDEEDTEEEDPVSHDLRDEDTFAEGADREARLSGVPRSSGVPHVVG